MRDLFKKYKNVILYGVIGILGAVIDLGIFALLYNVIGINAIIAKIISGFLAITNNFLWNAFTNFNVKNDYFKRFGYFLTIAIVGLIFALIVLWVVGKYTDWNLTIVNFLIIVFVVIVQYNLNKRISFRK